MWQEENAAGVILPPLFPAPLLTKTWQLPAGKRKKQENIKA
jgi:hypothetical protein